MQLFPQLSRDVSSRGSSCTIAKGSSSEEGVRLGTKYLGCLAIHSQWRICAPGFNIGQHFGKFLSLTQIFYLSCHVDQFTFHILVSCWDDFHIHYCRHSVYSQRNHLLSSLPGPSCYQKWCRQESWHDSKCNASNQCVSSFRPSRVPFIYSIYRL